MNNNQHDIHQFYFERYLRNKLSVAEKTELENQLASDAELQQAFQHYKSHRKDLLKELVQEHDKPLKRSRLLNYFYLTITIAGIFLTINFYQENETLKAERRRDKNLISRLLDHIPFISKTHKNKSAKPEKNSTYSNKPIEKPSDLNLEQADSTELKNLKEETESDTVITAWYAEQFTFTDSAATRFNGLKQSLLNAEEYDRYEGTPVGINFINTKKGNQYSYDGNTLTLYSLSKPSIFIFIREQGETIWVTPDQEIILIADQQLHSY